MTDLAALHPIASGETLEISSAWAGPVTFCCANRHTGTLQFLELHRQCHWHDRQGHARFARPKSRGGSDPNVFGHQPSWYANGVGRNSYSQHRAVGNYLASTFVASSDGHGGTSVIKSLITAITR